MPLFPSHPRPTLPCPDLCVCARGGAGCLCCTVRSDLISALNKLWRRKGEIDHIVIETTGLANPAPIISSFYAGG